MLTFQNQNSKMNLKTTFFVLILVLFGSFTDNFSLAQLKKEKVNSYFGLQFKPLIPGDFLGESEMTLRNGGFSANYSQQFGYTFGASVRIGITDLISIETGINQVQRNYNIDYSYSDSSISASDNFGIINYDVPVNALVYIKLSEEFYMNASLGGSMVFNPSNVAKLTFPGGLHEFIHEGRRRSRMGFEINANVGFEWRTEKAGFFYLGASGRIPIRPIFDVAAAWGYQTSTEQIYAIGEMNGTYLSIDLRYYLPNIKNKGTQPIKGPIEF
jgi:hypothetical protein